MENSKQKGRILSISIPFEQAEFLDTHPSASPSRIMQSAINVLIQNERDFDQERRIWAEKLAFMRTQCDKRTEFIERKGLMQEFEQNV